MTNPVKTQGFSHLDDTGQANMVDVSAKPDTERAAIAESRVVLGAAIVQKIKTDGLEKGDLFSTARIAGIQAAKRCADLIPLCHPLPLSKVSIELEFVSDSTLRIQALCKTTGKTGVEMEALTAASIAALTVYDMCKGVDKGITISSTELVKKTGGKSGVWERSGD